MRDSNELFLLISSMNRNEKGYFKKFTSINSKKGEGNYLRLFDCIEAMEVYDEDVIKKKFKGEKFLTQLNVTKLYLQKMILKSLRNYYNYNDNDIEMHTSVIDIMLMFKRQLYDSAQRMIDRQKVRAEEQEMFQHSLMLINIEYQIWLRKGRYSDILKASDAKSKLEKIYLRKYENLCEYKVLQGIVMSRTQMEGANTSFLSKEIAGLLSNPLLSDPASALSFTAHLHRLEIINKVYLKTGQVQSAYEYSKQMVELYQANPKQIKLQPYNYFASLNMTTNRCLSIGHYEEALKYVAESESMADDMSLRISGSQRFEMLTQSIEKRLNVYSKKAEFKKGLDVETRYREMIKDKPVRPEMKVVLIYQTAFCHLGCGQFKEALDLINKLVNGQYKDIRRDIILYSHWMSIIIHCDLGTHSIIKRQFTLLKNYLIKYKFNMEGSEAIFKQLSELIKSVSENDTVLTKKIASDLIPLVSAADFIDEDVMLWWLKGKLDQ